MKPAALEQIENVHLEEERGREIHVCGSSDSLAGFSEKFSSFQLQALNKKPQFNECSLLIFFLLLSNSITFMGSKISVEKARAAKPRLEEIFLAAFHIFCWK